MSRGPARHPKQRYLSKGRGKLSGTRFKPLKSYEEQSQKKGTSPLDMVIKPVPHQRAKGGKRS